MQLANLDNEIFFKKVFTDPEVFRAFVKDITGVDIIDAKIETEKRLERKVAAINFKLDIYAESIDKRVVIEIQRIDYDYSFDRFLHYFLALLVDLQRNSRDYSFEQDVYTIVVLTSPYIVKEKTGEIIKDDVLITGLNPRTLANEIRKIYPHKLIFLNPNYLSTETPPEIQDWLKFILSSIKTPNNPKYNQANAAIVKAAALANMENMPESVLEDAKIAEAKNKTARIYATKNFEEGKIEKEMEAIIGFHKNGVPVNIISKSLNISEERVMKIIEEFRV